MTGGSPPAKPKPRRWRIKEVPPQSGDWRSWGRGTPVAVGRNLVALLLVDKLDVQFFAASGGFQLDSRVFMRDFASG